MTQVSAGIYVRISRDSEGLGLGVARQERDCVDLCRRLGWQADDVYRDNDVSAFALRKPRPAYQRLLADVESGKLGAVVTWAGDRLHRSPRELEDFIDLLERRGAAVQTVQAGPIDLTTPAGRLVARQLGSVARYESEHRSARIRRKHIEIAERGLPNGGRRPYGYKVGGLVVEESEAQILREAASRVLAGESVRSIVSDLNERAVPSAACKGWHPPTLRDMLIRPRVAGLREFHGRILGPAAWPAIFAEDEWTALRHCLTDPSRRTTTTTARKHLLTGIATCSECATPVRIISGATSAGGYATYRCPTRRHVTRRMQEVDELIVRLVLGRLAMPDVAAIVESSEPSEGYELDRELGVLRARLEAEATAYAADEEMTAAEYATVARVLRTRIAKAEGRQAELVAPPSRALLGLAGRDDVGELWHDLDLSRKRAVISALMDVRLHPAGRGSRSFDPSTVEVIWRPSD